MTNDPDELLYDRAMARISRLILWFSSGGALGCLLWRGWKWGLGFALGAAASWINFRLLKQVADALGGRRIRLRVMILAGLRYLLLAAGAYVIVSFSPISLPAALIGLFVSVGAALVVAVIELAYARK